jgi:hypothetical protein
VLIDLYFPQSKADFEGFKKENQRLITHQEGPFENAAELKEEYSDLVTAGQTQHGPS